ncbi:V-type ATP synthase subunit K [Candidatus Bathyarchaeota archaeon]|nr:V-type ATP synthase subunit K [Candidatus Bathyarchaeota archaeon]
MNKHMKRRFYASLILLQVFLGFAVFFTVNGLIGFAAAQETPDNFDYFNSPTTGMLAISAALAISSAVIGSAWALKTVGTAAISSLSDEGEGFFKAFLVVALCEALAVYGLIVAILLWINIPVPP